MNRLSLIAAAALAAMYVTAIPARAAEPVKLSIGSFSQKSSWFAYSTRIADLLREVLPKGSTVDAPPKGGGTSSPLLVAAGKFDMALGFASVNGWARDGIIAYKKPMTNLRALVGGFDQYYLAVVALRDDKAKGLADYIKRHPDLKVVLRGKGSAGGFGGEQLLGFAGASAKDVTGRGGRYDKVGSFGVVKSALSSGKSDLWIHSVTRGHPALTDIALGTSLSFLQPSQGTLDDMTKAGWPAAGLPAGTFKGQDKDVTYPGTSTLLFASTAMSNDLAYATVKAICDNQDRFKAVHKALSTFDCAKNGWQPENVVLPLHDGAARYYKEKGWLK